jgi:hypothetical protein
LPIIPARARQGPKVRRNHITAQFHSRRHRNPSSLREKARESQTARVGKELSKSQPFEPLVLLLAHGADLNARTRIDDYATPLEEMEILGREQAAAFLKKAAEKKG